MKDFIYIIHLMYLLNKERIYHMINDINKSIKSKKFLLLCKLTLLAPTPTNISTKSEPEIEKNGTLASPATARAKRVFPVPGGPSNSTPFCIIASFCYFFLIINFFIIFIVIIVNSYKFFKFI